MEIPYPSIKEELVNVVRQLQQGLTEARAIPGPEDHAMAEWEKTLGSIERQIGEDIVRVAVVGAIKSGKSTFVNALLKNDYLKRGAGVVTSIVTRVRGGDRLEAKLFFKTWDEINDEINDALVLFPSPQWRSRDDHFDLRRQQDRSDLEAALGALSGEQLISRGQRTANSVLLSAFLKGYERTAAIVSTETRIETFSGAGFADHREFVGDDALAVYLRDVELTIDAKVIDDHMEIADCQGSDSPNPLHLTMIQDYLLKTHLIVYVISSRTGLRDADIRFLSMIRKMGIMENIMFVLNCDLNEHDSIEGLDALVEKAREELGAFVFNPEIYTFSALLNLFEAIHADLPDKDRSRYELWGAEEAFVAFSAAQSARFEGELQRKVSGERYALLLKNHLERLDVVAVGMGQWIHLTRDLLSKDRSEALGMVDKIAGHQAKITQLKSMVKSTLNGAVEKIKGEIRNDTDRFFDARSGRLMEDLIAYIRAFRVSLGDYEQELAATGFASTLYTVFQEFKHGLDTYMTETVNPAAIEFSRQAEERIRSDLQSIAGPYDVMVQEACSEYNDAMGRLGVATLPNDFGQLEPLDLEMVKSAAGLALPPAEATLRYSAKIKTEAVVRFGFYAVVKRVKKLFKQSPASEHEDAIQALKDGVLKIKRETEKSILSLFRDYQEGIKFQYLFKLIDAAANTLYDRLMERFQSCVTDLSRMSAVMGDHQKDKQDIIEHLEAMERNHSAADDQIQTLKSQLE